MRFKRRTKLLGGLATTTPLVDIVFNLLIFFMLSSSFIVHPGIKIKLPQASIKESERETKLNVTITRNNRIFLNDKRVRLKDLLREMKDFISTEREEILFIKADSDVRHGLVVEIMDIAKRAGVERLAIATQPKGTK